MNNIFSNYKVLFPGLFLTILSLIPIVSHAQEEKEEEENVIAQGLTDTNFIENYTELVTTRVYGLFQEAGLRTNSYELNQLSYRPNIPGRLGVAAFYKWFGLGISLGIPYLLPSEDRFGKTDFYDLRANAYGNQIAAELYIHNYKGYHLGNYKNNELYLVPDMRIFSLGGYGYYFYNYKRFSIRAAFIQNERQIKSAGSLVIRPSLIYYRFTSDNGIVPPELVALLTNSNASVEIPKEGYFYSYGLAPGYTYTFVFFKNCYINAAVYPGFYYQVGRYSTNYSFREISDMSLSLGIKAAIGYNSDKWFTGAGFSTSIGGVPARLSGAEFYYDITQFRVWLGTRFNWFKGKK